MTLPKITNKKNRDTNSYLSIPTPKQNPNSITPKPQRSQNHKHLAQRPSREIILYATLILPLA